MIQALYIDPRGVYPGLLGAENCWGLPRDAKLYNGPHAIVAHPPCGPWGPMRGLCKIQDASCAIRAVDQVRAFGGVLEHPEGSRLWADRRLPPPGETDGVGWTTRIEQVSWGHCCTKPTWLYTVNVPRSIIAETMRTGGAPTHRVTSGPRWKNSKSSMPSASRNLRARTTKAFAEWLISLARLADARTAATSAAA